ncbi:uncharacterized protein LOC123228672 isoform X1 [Mangifera indica]|uniref:uncharacterized protein LOC123228672 isoform X1 n=1 Tax=Mangifera indica TaxID=29780 RepID=UPI001CF9B16A|nr:uncharacterized protein LOC123228672 isoform X1 [Mangifera indica]
MATSRLFLTAEPLRHAFSSSTCSSSSSTNAVRCMGKAGFNGEKRICGNADQRRPTLPTKTSVAPLDSLLITTKPADFIDALLKVSRQILERRPWKSIQMLIERVIIDCRFFTLFAVAGSLLGSVLCFLEGSFLVLKSYFQFFNTLSPKNDHGHMVHLIIEAIDLFLVGTAMLIFGVGLYAMFVGSKNITEKEQLLSGSNLFGLFHMKRLPKWVEMESVWEAKSKLGHAVMIILQVGVLEKFNTITLVTSLDMVCFAGALLISSVCTFLLSRLSVSRNLPFHILS